jgi:hypothetical protein
MEQYRAERVRDAGEEALDRTSLVFAGCGGEWYFINKARNAHFLLFIAFFGVPITFRLSFFVSWFSSDSTISFPC